MLIAQLMLQPADVLLLDEPTNDLDIPTLEILEESLLEFRGSLVLVTHDRYMLDRVSTVVLGLDGQGGAESFARLLAMGNMAGGAQTGGAEQYSPVRQPGSSKPRLRLRRRNSPIWKPANTTASSNASPKPRKCCKQSVFSSKIRRSPAMARVCCQAHAELEAAQDKVDTLYARWAELEKKKGESCRPGQRARQKAMMVSPLTPVVLLQLLQQHDSRSPDPASSRRRQSPLQMHPETEFANAETIFRLNRRTKDAAGHGPRFVEFAMSRPRVEDRTRLVVGEIRKSFGCFVAFIQYAGRAISREIAR